MLEPDWQIMQVMLPHIESMNAFGVAQRPIVTEEEGGNLT
jgi:hypothetical protein